MEDKIKPKYNIWQNVCFMLKMSWISSRGVPFLCLLSVFLNVLVNLLQLFLAPQVLLKVEQHAPLLQMLLTIVLFAGSLFLLNALHGYLRQNSRFPKIRIRLIILNTMNLHAGTTSYPNTLDPEILKLRDKASEATQDNVSAAENIWNTLIKLLTNICCFVIYLFIMSALDPVLLLTIALTSAVVVLVNWKVDQYHYKLNKDIGKYDLQVWYITGKAHSNALAKDIRIFGLKPWLDDLWNCAMRMMEALVLKKQKARLLGNLTELLMTLARNGVAYIYLIHKALEENMPASEFLLYFSAVSGFAGWVSGIISDFFTLRRESNAISLVQEYLNLPEPFRFDGGKPVPEADSWELQLEHVTFRYPGSEQKLFRDLNLTIHPGEKLAIVGLNGAGKTTLVKLLCGFFDPDEGRVLLNGTDIREFNRQDYYRLFSAVFQELSLLDVTIAENIAQQTTGIDLDKVNSCIEKAGLAEYIASLPEGLNTHLGREVYLDGVLMSGGQTQRILLARALYKDGPILILDEPTAALDPLAENDIYMKYHEMTRGKTSLFISHRLASTRFCDRIIFLADGSIAEEGTHETLLEKNGAYAKLFEVQSRYYQEGRNFREETVVG